MQPTSACLTCGAPHGAENNHGAAISKGGAGDATAPNRHEAQRETRLPSERRGDGQRIPPTDARQSEGSGSEPNRGPV